MTFNDKLDNTLDGLYYQAVKGDEYHGRTESVKTAKQAILDLIEQEIIGVDKTIERISEDPFHRTVTRIEYPDYGNELRAKQRKVLRGKH